MQERKREAETLVRRAEEREQALPFNQPYAVADFHHWSRAAHWTLDEAIALSFGKAPEVVSWEKVKSHVQVSPARESELAIQAAREAEEARIRLAAEEDERAAALKAVQKAERDARYAARKAAKKVRRRGY